MSTWFPLRILELLDGTCNIGECYCVVGLVSACEVAAVGKRVEISRHYTTIERSTWEIYFDPRALVPAKALISSKKRTLLGLVVGLLK